jgi:peptide/histidine transporter 3/4
MFLIFYSAIGVGAVQANMAVFGAEQVREQKATRQYFDKYYAAVNTGGLIAFGFIAYVQQNDSYFIGYTVPAGLLIIALVFFLIGYKFYVDIRPDDSVLSSFIPVMINAFQTRRKYRQNAQISAINRRSSDTSRLFSGQSENNNQLLSAINEQSWSFLVYAKLSNQGQFLDRLVDDIKSVRRIIIVFLLLIPYWHVYIQVKNQKNPKFFRNLLHSFRLKQLFLYKVYI